MNTPSEPLLLDMNYSILQDRSDLAHADYHESCEDRCGEELHVNRSGTVRFYLLRKLECLRHALTKSVFCVLVCWCSGRPLSRCVLRAAPRFARFARLALLERCFSFRSSVVSSFSVLCCLLHAALVWCVPHLSAAHRT